MLEGMENKVKYDLKNSRKMTGQLEECSDLKVMQIVFNGRTFKYHLGGCRFHMLPQSNKFYHGHCLNNSPQILLIGNHIYQFTPFIHINHEDEVSHLIRVMKVLGNMKYLENWDVKRVK